MLKNRHFINTKQILISSPSPNSFSFNFKLNKKYSSKVLNSFDEAVSDIKSGNKLIFGGFGLCGIPENLISALLRRDDLINLDVVSDNAGVADFGLGLLLQKRMINKMTSSFIGHNYIFERQYLDGDIELELVPQGSLAEKLRCGGAGIPAFYTPTGVGTQVEHGGIIMKYNKQGGIVKVSQQKDSLVLDGKKYLLEQSIKGDFSLIKGWKGDTKGNIVFRKTARNFNYDAATAGKICIAEVEELVQPGEIKPDEIHLPGIYVTRILKGEKYEKRIENIMTSDDSEIRNKIAKRAALEVKPNSYVNLGIGIPTLMANFIPQEMSVDFHSENGMLGVGPYPNYKDIDPDLINPGKETVSETKGCVYFKSSDSFAMIRGGHLDFTVLGGLQVSKWGDLASWIIPGKMVKGMGGAMDLVANGTKVIVTMKHSQNKKPKILDKCTLPLTGQNIVYKLITELGVFEFPKDKGITLTEMFEGVSLDMIKFETGCSFCISDNLKTIKV